MSNAKHGGSELSTVSPMAYRGIWTFTYSRLDMIEAASAKARWHTDRAAYWEAEERKAEATFRETGVSLDGDEMDSFAMVTASSYGNGRAGVKVDPKLQAAWQMAQSKLSEHRAAAKDFWRWVHLFKNAETGREFVLTVADALFFGIQDIPDTSPQA